MISKDSPLFLWNQLISVWMSGQIGLPKAQRWKTYDTAEHGGIRHQDSLQHSYSIMVLARILIHYLRREGVKLDSEFFLTSVMLHDHGEGELGFDVVYIDKTPSDDLNEYLAFRKRFETLEPDLYAEFEQAFLLQFAAKDSVIFPDQARRVMAKLREERPVEILAFEGLERWDYLFFPLEQWAERGNKRILVQVLRNQMPHMDRIVGGLPEFGRAVWTQEIRGWCQTFLTQHEGQWVQETRGR